MCWGVGGLFVVGRMSIAKGDVESEDLTKLSDEELMLIARRIPLHPSKELPIPSFQRNGSLMGIAGGLLKIAQLSQAGLRRSLLVAGSD